MTYTVTSIFSGAGGFDFPFTMLGFDIRFAIDNDPDACSTYALNVGSITLDDIRTHPIPTERTDVLIGGFPCPSFSTCGYGKGFADERGQLFFVIPDYLRSVKPIVFVLENVDNILTKDGGSIAHHIVRALSAGYDVYSMTVNCENFGISQRRHRALFIGTRNDVTPIFSYAPVNDRSLTPSWYWLDTSPDVDDSEYTCDKRTLDWLSRERRSNIPYNPRYPRNKYRIDPNGICGTLTTDIGHSMGLFHHTHDRKLTIEEYSRLQGFPPYYEWYGDPASIGTQIGNAFPPLVAFHLARQLVSWLSMASITIARRNPMYITAKL